MPARTSTPRRSHARTRDARTAASVRSAAERAVATVLGSDEAFALLIERLEAAGWRVERDAGHAPSLTPPARPR